MIRHRIREPAPPSISTLLIVFAATSCVARVNAVKVDSFSVVGSSTSIISPVPVESLASDAAVL